MAWLYPTVECNYLLWTFHIVDWIVYFQCILTSMELKCWWAHLETFLSKPDQCWLPHITNCIFWKCNKTPIQCSTYNDRPNQPSIIIYSCIGVQDTPPASSSKFQVPRWSRLRRHRMNETIQFHYNDFLTQNMQTVSSHETIDRIHALHHDIAYQAQGKWNIFCCLQ